MFKLKGKDTGEKKLVNDQLKEAFLPVETKFFLLFYIGVEVEMKLTEDQLQTLLAEGNGTYWELEWSEGGDEILRIIPYTDLQVAKNLYDQRFDDVMYDFESRL